MLFVMRASEDGKQLMLSIEPDWDHAGYASVPHEIPAATLDEAGLSQFMKRELLEQQRELAKTQGLVLILNGPDQVRAFAQQMNDAPEPWCNYAAAFCGVAEEAGFCAAAHLWMPNFHDTPYGKARAALRKEIAC